MAYIKDKRTQLVIGTLLRTGVFLSAAVVLIGAFLFLAQAAHSNSAYTVFRGEPAELRSLAGIVRGAARSDAAAIIQLGLLLLIATPIARVVFSAAAFALERDWLYVLITLIVLAILLGSLLCS
jgi:uncharacterized membrane protein